MIATLTFKKKDPWSGYKIYDNCKHAISSYIMRSGVRYTGLNGGEHAATKERLEKELGVDLSPQSEYWDTFAIFLTSRDEVLDTSIPEQELKFNFLKAHKRVAFGLNDNKPSTEYLLLQAEEEAKEQNTKARLRRRALSEFDKLSVTDLRQALRLFGYNSSNTTAEVAENILSKLVEESPEKFIRLWVDNTSKSTQFLIEEACAKGVLRKQQSTYKYGADVLGYSLDQTINHLENPANGDLKATILSQLEGKDVSFGTAKPKEEESTSEFAKLMKEIDKEEKTVEDKKETKGKTKSKK